MRISGGLVPPTEAADDSWSIWKGFIRLPGLPLPLLCWMDVPDGSDVAWKIAAISALQTMRMSLTTKPVVALTPMLALGSSLLVTSMDAPLARYRVISSELLGPVPSTPIRP